MEESAIIAAAAASIFVMGAVAGFVEFVKRLFAKDWKAAIIIAGAGSIGAAAGHFLVDGLTLPTGLIAGLAASGYMTIGQKTGTGTGKEVEETPSDSEGVR